MLEILRDDGCEWQWGYWAPCTSDALKKEIQQPKQQPETSAVTSVCPGRGFVVWVVGCLVVFFLNECSQGLEFVTGTSGVHFTSLNPQVADGKQGEARREGPAPACCAQRVSRLVCLDHSCCFHRVVEHENEKQRGSLPLPSPALCHSLLISVHSYM